MRAAAIGCICHTSGPVLPLGALFAAMVSLGIVDGGPHWFSGVVSGALLLAPLSFVAELIRKRYL
jgi:hypothetical protein